MDKPKFNVDDEVTVCGALPAFVSGQITGRTGRVIGIFHNPHAGFVYEIKIHESQSSDLGIALLYEVNLIRRKFTNVRGLKMSLLILLVASALAADVEPDFQPYVTSFKHDYFKYRHQVVYLGNLKIFWSYGNENRAGACAKRSDGYKWIEINKIRSGWGNYTECQREELIYHELGHCLLNLEHSESGIMHYGVRDNETCERTREQSKAILFGGGKK